MLVQFYKLRIKILLLILSFYLGSCAVNTPANHRYILRGVKKIEQAQNECSGRQPLTWALIIGINFYQDEAITDLSGAVNDAWTLYHYFVNPKGLAIPEQQIKLLLNEEATRNHVEGAMGNLLSQSCHQDQIFIYFSGHGAPEPNRPNDAFLLLHDTRVDNMVGSAISMQRLPDFLKWRNDKTGKLILIVDACHSGNIAFSKIKGVKKKPTEEAIERSGIILKSLKHLSQDHQNWAIITASAASQYAQEGNQQCQIGNQSYQGGLFTCQLLNAISGAADWDQNHHLSLKEIYSFLKKEVTHASNGTQVPQLSTLMSESIDLFELPKSSVSIPKIPNAYLIENPSTLSKSVFKFSAISSFLFAGIGYLFNNFTNQDTNQLNHFDYQNKTKDAYDQLLSDRNQNQNLANTFYTTALGLLGISLFSGAYYWMNPIENRNDAYQASPWLEINQLKSKSRDENK